VENDAERVTQIGCDENYWKERRVKRHSAIGRGDKEMWQSAYCFLICDFEALRWSLDWESLTFSKSKKSLIKGLGSKTNFQKRVQAIATKTNTKATDRSSENINESTPEELCGAMRSDHLVILLRDS
jgi:hypothetical protein